MFLIKKDKKNIYLIKRFTKVLAHPIYFYYGGCLYMKLVSIKDKV
jgi:hypothetical protein